MRGYDDFGFYDHSDIMTKMVWSQGGHIKRRLLYLGLFRGPSVTPLLNNLHRLQRESKNTC